MPACTTCRVKFCCLINSAGDWWDRDTRDIQDIACELRFVPQDDHPTVKHFTLHGLT